MSLSRCGRVYPTFGDAVKAAQQLTYKTGKTHVSVSCAFDDHWHVVSPSSVIKPKPPARLDPFPPLIARLIDKRDGGHCQRCGRSGRLERHHRRAKGSGGSKARAHTQCPCNALSLCRRCHADTHEHPGEARDYGWIVRQAVALPARSVVSRCIDVDDDGWPVFDEQYPTCDGRWVHSPMETED